MREASADEEGRLWHGKTVPPVKASGQADR